MGTPADEGCKSLYVGNLDPRVTDSMLHEIFGVAGSVNNTKIIPDKNYQHGGLNYGFVEFNDHRSAEQALQTLNGRKIYNMEIKVNWAFQGQQGHKEDTSNHYHIFVGDLSPEVNDEVLAKAFSAFGSMSDARVMWDVNSGKSRGYGFVAFRDKTDAEQAIATMNGEWLGSRAIRCNWANQKGQPGPGSTSSERQGNPTQAPQLSYDIVVAQTPQYNCTVYVGNLPPYTTQEHLIPYFQPFGFIIEVRMQADRGFAFVKLDSHENAAHAIVNLQNTNINGRVIKCSWGKDRAPEAATTTYHPYGVQNTAYNYSPYGYYGNHTGHHYASTESGYDLPPGMSAPPPSLTSLDSATAAAVAAGQQPHATAGWEQYYNNGYEAYGQQYYPYGYGQAVAPGAPGMGAPASPHAVAGGHPPSVGGHGPSGGSAYSG
ncbi:699_t:CDS:10 [Acaulospora morrowiae]|uniref:699_t:CDS:1 n=2 Tax=Diversisporales TaxID=214509 RepID=A0A9N9A770_9GLOM|nr:699_t:CDS:10 [Acaulospora morrowiae]